MPAYALTVAGDAKLSNDMNDTSPHLTDSDQQANITSQDHLTSQQTCTVAGDESSVCEYQQSASTESSKLS